MSLGVVTSVSMFSFSFYFILFFFLDIKFNNLLFVTFTLCYAFLILYYFNDILPSFFITFYSGKHMNTKITQKKTE